MNLRIVTADKTMVNNRRPAIGHSGGGGMYGRTRIWWRDFSRVAGHRETTSNIYPSVGKNADRWYWYIYTQAWSIDITVMLNLPGYEKSGAAICSRNTDQGRRQWSWRSIWNVPKVSKMKSCLRNITEWSWTSIWNVPKVSKMKSCLRNITGDVFFTKVLECGSDLLWP